MDYRGKKALVVGCGKSGIAAANLLARRGAEVILQDGNEKLDQKKVEKQLKDPGKVDLCLGALGDDVPGMLDFAVVSPGVPLDSPLALDLKTAGVEIISEIELAYRCGKGDVLAVTGTNGKTTTVALLGGIMAMAYPDVRVVGNIGNPYADAADTASDDTKFVAEISSFQLETSDTFHPKVSAIMNITPDHMNRHHTMENYVNIKLSITKNQTAEDVCVLNYEDEILRKFGENAKPSVIWFSSQRELEKGFYLKDGAIYAADEKKTEKVIAVDELNLLGAHNYENVMAASAMALSYGVDMETLRKALRAFKAVEHRIEFVCEKRGVRYYNDSKATNTDAAIRGIQAMNRPTFLIGGGYDKQSTYDDWIESFGGKVKKLVLIGETKKKIADTANRHGFHDYVFADSLEEAVRICAEGAQAGDAVLLSPCCASWDMFPNFEVRGRQFKELARKLPD